MRFGDLFAVLGMDLRHADGILLTDIGDEPSESPQGESKEKEDTVLSIADDANEKKENRNRFYQIRECGAFFFNTSSSSSVSRK